jgi:hypothetical protein
MVERFLSEIKVYDLPVTKGRLGNEGDGGYVVAMEHLALANDLYSFGIGNDVGFELDFLSLFPKAKAHLFDPTIQSPPCKHDRFNFERTGIDSRALYGGLPWGIEPDSILKIDAEWDEWEALLEMPLNRLGFSQIIIEFHILHLEPRSGLSPYFTGLYQSLVNKQNWKLFHLYGDVMVWMNSWYRCFHIHANNSLPMVNVDGYQFPPLLEMSFLRKDLADSDIKPASGPFPISGLDFANKKDRPDVINWFPLIKEERCSTNGLSR